jgi:hypothetical protein
VRALAEVDETPLTITIDYDGNGTADEARIVDVYNTAGSNAVYCVTQGTAVAEGAPLVAAEFAYTFDRRDRQPIRQLSCVCTTAETATIYVIADP